MKGLCLKFNPRIGCKHWACQVTSNILVTQKWLQKGRLNFPLAFSLSCLFNLSTLSHAFIKLPVFNKILSKKIVHKRKIDKYIFSFYPVQWLGVLIWVVFRCSRKEMASFVILKISVLSLNSFFSQNGDRKLEFTS